MPKFTPLTTEQELGHGVSRRGYLLSNPNLVLKVAREDGLNNPEFNKMANLIEVAIWNTVKDTEYKDLFVPILAAASDGSWVIMPKVELASDYYGGLSDDYYEKKYLLESFGIGDLHENNMTVDGRVLDYSTYDRYQSPKVAASMVKRLITRKSSGKAGGLTGACGLTGCTCMKHN